MVDFVNKRKYYIALSLCQTDSCNNKHLHVKSLITDYIWLDKEDKKQMTYTIKGPQKKKMHNSEEYRILRN